MLTRNRGTAGQGRDTDISFDNEADVPKVRKITRRIYPKSEIGIQTSTENVSKEMTETNFVS